MGIDVLCGAAAVALLCGKVRNPLVRCKETMVMLRKKANAAFLCGTASIDAVRGQMILATMRGKAGGATTATVGEQGCIALVCGRVNFGAFRGRVTVALLWGRVYVTIFLLPYSAGSSYRHATRIGRNFCCMGGRRGYEGGEVKIAMPCGDVNWALGSKAMFAILRILSGSSIIRSVLLN